MRSAEMRKVVDMNRKTVLILAAENGHRDVVQYVMNVGVNVNKQDSSGMTALMYASKRGDISIVRMLVGAGVDVSLKDKIGMTALIMACRYGHDELVSVLLSNGAIVDGQDIFRRSSLMLACKYGHRNVLKMLLQGNADIYLLDRCSRTAVDISIENGYPEFVDLLVGKESSGVLNLFRNEIIEILFRLANKVSILPIENYLVTSFNMVEYYLINHYMMQEVLFNEIGLLLNDYSEEGLEFDGRKIITLDLIIERYQSTQDFESSYLSIITFEERSELMTFLRELQYERHLYSMRYAGQGFSKRHSPHPYPMITTDIINYHCLETIDPNSIKSNPLNIK